MTSSRSAGPQPPVELVPCVLHGSWLPEQADGRFLLWAETTRSAARPRAGEHPFQVRKEGLATALSATVPAGPDGTSGFGAEPKGAWVALPGDGARPVPSLELQTELEGEIPAAQAWGVWRVDAAAVGDPLAFLEALDLESGSGAAPVRIGQDLRYWRRLAVRLGQALRGHEYLPSIQAEPLPAPARKGRRRKSAAPRAEFSVGWEWSETIEADIVEPFARAMPGVCRTLWRDQPELADGRVLMREPRGLVRHFLETHLQRAVRGTRFPRSALAPVDASVLIHALPEPSSWSGQDIRADPVTEPIWSQWRRWRDRIQRGSRDADEVICMRLVDAPGGSPDAWRLEWLLGSRRDPSLLVPLAEFWALGQGRRPEPRRVREVLTQLGQAARIYERLWEGMRGDQPAGLALDRAAALEFLREQAPILQSAGFRVMVPSWWTATGQRRLRVRLRAQNVRSAESAGNESIGCFGFDSLVEFTPQVVLDGEPLTPSEWEQLVKAKGGLVQLRGQWMELRSEEVARLEEYWNGGDGLQSMTVADLVRAQADADRAGVEIIHEGAVERALGALCGSGALEMLAQPDGFVGQLREYQIRGLSWLAYLERLGFGACLADDMGLGKTIQVIATMLADKRQDPKAGPTLLIAPTSVLGNWQKELGRFAPELSACIHHGTNRATDKGAFEKAIAGKDLVIASFGVARLDAAVLKRIPWRRLVVDESQNIKNPTAAVTKAIRSIKAGRRIALTGTPVENRLMDLWSLFSFLNPGFLGTMTDFRKTVERPIMREGDKAAADRLRGMVRPFILRRMKTDKAIIKDLPEKVEQKSYCNLTPEQATLYEAVVRETEAKLKEAEGIGRQGLMLSTLMRLKQICNHPAQFLQDASDFAAARSHKLSRVCEMLEEIEDEGESALVFTQFAEVGKSLESLFRKRYGGAVYYLHGGTSRALREHMVEEFQNPDTDRAIFVLSLRAGGTGITLTRANHVIHFDRWWNPAVENQATDRAYRIGQQKSVFVHKMVTMGTLEERIDELIESKRQLAEEIVGSDESWLANLDNDSFRALISLDRAEAVVG